VEWCARLSLENNIKGSYYSHVFFDGMSSSGRILECYYPRDLGPEPGILDLESTLTGDGGGAWRLAQPTGAGGETGPFLSEQVAPVSWAWKLFE